MNQQLYQQIEGYMQECMTDSAHDKEHIYRVLYMALDIAKYEQQIDMEILIVSALLHDIGREDQFKDPRLCHAKVGSEKAYKYLLHIGFNEERANQIRECIYSHRFRSDNPPISIEAKILFDADKLDVTGTLGIARTLVYKGIVSDPLYSVDHEGNILDGSNDTEASFFQEYKYKLENVYDKFYTIRGCEIASERKQSAVDFYDEMLKEVKNCYDNGEKELKNILQN
jgi:uncharacterized protein